MELSGRLTSARQESQQQRLCGLRSVASWRMRQ
jgi:hypothetical protein